MKKIFVFVFVSMLTAVMAADVASVPASITVSCGDVTLRLDKAKRWNINSVKLKNEQLGLDTPGAHYGMTHMVRGSKGFIGSGHIETGIVEEVKSIRFFVDSTETEPAGNMRAKQNFYMEKVSVIGNFEATYSFSLENNIIVENIKLVCLDKVQLGIVYCFMHPWVTAFKKYYGISPDGEKVSFDMVPDGTFPNQKFMPKIAMLNPVTGTALATEITFVRGKPASAKRLMWTRPVYNKDYIVAAASTSLAKDSIIEITAKTVFFKSTPDTFAADAEKTFMIN